MPDELFACGLLAQIGRLALATVFPPTTRPCSKSRLTAGRCWNWNDLVWGWITLNYHGHPRRLRHCRALRSRSILHEAPETSGFAEGSRPYQLAHLLFQARRMADLGLSPETQRHGRILN